jgi:group I intron endonuclease
MYGIIYCIENIQNGKKYIGQTTMGLAKRWCCHVSEAKRNKIKMPICAAIRKYGSDNFLIYQLAWARTLEELNAAEVLFINTCNTLHSKHGYNARMGGGGGKLTEQARKRMSNARKGSNHWAFGKKRNPEHQAKLTAARRLRGPTTQDTRDKLSRASKGHVVTAETRRKIGEARRGHKMPAHVKAKLLEANKDRPSHLRKGVICVTTGQIFSSQREAALCMGISFAQMSRLVRGLHEHSKGLKFESYAARLVT